jgi:hypothetical protein
MRPYPVVRITVDDIARFAPYFDLSHATPIDIAPGVVGVTFIDAEHSSFGSSTEAVWFGPFGDTVWLGKIDDVRIYTRALSVTEVQQLYNAGR